MKMSLAGITQDQRDAIRILDAFATALARGGIFSSAACKLAADEMEKPGFSEPEDETEDAEVIAAIVKWLREQEG